MTSTLLGYCDFFGKEAQAYREVKGDKWTFVIVVDGERHVLLSY